ncbi:MAG: ribonuclease HII [Candidatus Aenigmarchaeota archaeon]|nr:ribonuclease HII [Candidatus Aenigmarchaeota archaeon]
MIAGIDEAGRGAVIGPLVIAGVSVEEGRLDRLKALGVRDSKLLSPKRREHLAREIEKLAKDVMILKVGPCKIDGYRSQGVDLNRLEFMKMSEVISFLRPNAVYVDSPDVKPERLVKILSKSAKDVRIVAEHKADVNYPVVGAASIVAKVARDGEIEKLKKKYGDVGPGYSSNPITMEWLRQWLAKNREFPEGVVRKSWITSSMVKSEKSQGRLHFWLDRLKGSQQAPPAGDE